MCVDPMLNVKFRTSVLHVTAQLTLRQYLLQSKVAFGYQPPVSPTVNVAPIWCVTLASVILSVSKISSVHRVKAVQEEYAKRFVSVIATAYKEKCALKVRVCQAAAAALIAAFMKFASQKNACVIKDFSQARVAVLTLMSVKRIHVTRQLPASICLAHISALVLPPLWVTHMQRLAVSSLTPALMTAHARETKHVRRLKMEYWNALIHVPLLFVGIMHDARW